MTLHLLEWAARRYLAQVHRYPSGVAIEGALAWACAWKLARR